MGMSTTQAPRRRGAWEVKANNTIYLAAHDGTVNARDDTGGSHPAGFTDGSTPPTTQRYRTTSGAAGGGLSMEVKKGDYWKVDGCSHVYWIPFIP